MEKRKLILISVCIIAIAACVSAALILTTQHDVTITGGELSYDAGMVSEGANAYYAMMYGDDYVAYCVSINATGLNPFKTYTISAHWYDDSGEFLTSNSRDLDSQDVKGGKLIEASLKGRDPNIVPASYAIVKILDGDKVLEEAKISYYDGSKDFTNDDLLEYADP